MQKLFKRSILAGAAVTAMLAVGGTLPPASAHGFGQPHVDRHHDDYRAWRRAHHKKPEMAFKRIATFPVFLNSDIDNETVAEIVDVSMDGRTLVYTDSPLEAVGFVDISNPANPQPLGKVDLPGEPTSVAVWKRYALVAVNTSKNYVETSGQLIIIDMKTHAIVRSLDLGGQPDSVAVSPDHRYAAVAIENERDEDLGDGAPPQMPAGYLMIVDTVGGVANWSTRKVDLTGVADLFPEDPEPEFVDINADNQVVVTIQENNHLVIVDLPSGNIVNDFSAGTVNLDQTDTDDNGLIEFTDSLFNVAREPDGTAWLDRRHFVIANEGDLYGGGRGITIFDTDGDIDYDSGNFMDHLAASIGHYPEKRSDNKGVEPENVAEGHFGRDHYLFVNSERGSFVFVYKLPRHGDPEYVQALPAGGIGPEGGLTIPSRGLYVTASEKDSREDKYRGGLTIFQLQRGEPSYPKIESANRVDGTPIPWAALSGLAVDPQDHNVAYTVHDSFYKDARIYVLDISAEPALITDEIPLSVSDDLDLEGIAVSSSGGFWVASEGNAGSRLNRLLQVAEDGTVLQTVTLPASVEARKVKFGFEGVASVMEDVGGGKREVLYVAFQREWDGDPDGMVRIGRYDTVSGDWTYAYYPLETPASPNGGWVGLSEITPLGHGKFAVIERDNQAGPDARIKLITRIDVNDVTFQDDSHAGSFDVLGKVVARDLVAKGDLVKAGGPILEKLESLAVLPNGTALVINDNDGVDDSTGETQLYRIPHLFAPHHPAPFAWWRSKKFGWN